MSYLNMDLNDTKVGLGFDPVPAGAYQAQIIDSELGHSKNDNLMLNLTWMIIDGDCAERMVYDRIMLSGSDKAITFGKRRLKTLAEAIGHPNPNRIDDSTELHGLPCLITVIVRKGGGEYSDSNEVKNYQPLTSSAPQQSAAAAVAPPANSPPTQSAAPPKTQAPPLPPGQKTSPPPNKPRTPFEKPAGGPMAEAGGGGC